MAYKAKILADSMSITGHRLTTFEITYPRFVHSELMTHRLFSRNSASSRAIPIRKMIDAVVSDPVLPVYWGANQKGMQAELELSDNRKESAITLWLYARDLALKRVHELDILGVHKQIVNRLLEPWMWITVIVSATEWANFFNLRCHADAQPEIRRIAEMMRDLYYSNSPDYRRFCFPEEWHLPLINMDEEDYNLLMGCSIDEKKMISVGRCARVSYLTHDGKRDPAADIVLCERLQESGHWSPFEHVATPCNCGENAFEKTGSHAARYFVDCKYKSNFRGWHQFRKYFPNEHRTEYKPC